MDINTIKTRAAELAAVGADELTADQATELRALVADIEAHAANTELATRALAAAQTAEVVAPIVDAAPATVGEAFVRAASFNSRGASNKVEIDTRALTTGDLVINPTIITGSTPDAPANLTGLVSVVPVSTNDVSYVVAVPTYGAAVVAEGDLKPETTLSFESASVVLDTIANFADITRQAIADGAQVTAVVNGALTKGLSRKIETSVAAAITGSADIQVVTAAAALSGVRNAAAVVEAEGYTPDAFICNPADLAGLDLEVVNSFRSATRGSQFWGLTAVTSTLVPVGTFYVGDFASAVTLFTKGGVDVYSTDADGDKFRKNIVTILAETRVKAALLAPAAIRKVTVS